MIGTPSLERVPEALHRGVVQTLAALTCVEADFVLARSSAPALW
jgi:hypothetical protein